MSETTNTTSKRVRTMEYKYNGAMFYLSRLRKFMDACNLWDAYDDFFERGLRTQFTAEIEYLKSQLSKQTEATRLLADLHAEQIEHNRKTAERLNAPIDPNGYEEDFDDEED